MDLISVFCETILSICEDGHVNILDKTDKSTIKPNPNQSPIKKTDHYKWTSEGPQGEFRMIPKDQLNIDGTYQRGAVGSVKIRKIAKDWDWLLFGTLSVVEREDGSLWVFDGGHRTRASFYRSDVSELPCMVHLLENVSDEAKAFVARNTMTTNVNAIDMQRAGLKAREPIAMQVESLLIKHGLVAKKTCSAANHIKCVNTLRKMVSLNAELADRCLAYMIDKTGGQYIASTPLRGLFALCNRFIGQVDILSEYGAKLSIYNQKSMEIAIRQKKAEVGKGGEAVEGMALLDLVNKGKRKKLKW